MLDAAIREVGTSFGTVSRSPTEYLLLLAVREQGLAALARFHRFRPRRRDLRAQYSLVDKSDLRTDFQRHVPSDLKDRVLWWKTTSGTSGRPVDIPYDAAFYLDFKYGVFHKAWRMRLGRRLGRRPYLALVVTDLPDEEPSVFVDPLYSQGLVLRVSVDVSRPSEIQRVVALMRALRPNILSTKPSVLAALMAAVPVDSERIDLILAGGAATSKDLRATVEARLGPLASIYATSELGVLGSECAYGRLHAFESDIQVVDAHPGAPGEIVASNDTNTALRLTCYRTGDRGVLARDACPCGCPWAWFSRLEGRVAPLFRFAGGELLTPARFQGFLRAFPMLREFQVTQTGPTDLLVAVEPLDEGSKHEAPPTGIEAYFRQFVPQSVCVSVRKQCFDPNEKFARFRVDL